MIALERILVPTDFSEFSREALKYGCELANRFGATLHLLHVVQDFQPYVPEAGMMLVDPHEYLAALKKDAEAALKQLPGADWTEVDQERIVRSVLEGVPFVQIVRYVRDHDIDLIVIGSHGRTGLSHALMGSVAERVVRKAPCPVLTVRLDQHKFVLP